MKIDPKYNDQKCIFAKKEEVFTVLKERKKEKNFSLIEDHSRGIRGPPASLAHGEQRPYYSYHKKKKKKKIPIILGVLFWLK